MYNANPDNLKLHGLHPLYTHVLVNLPQILGPGLLFIVSKGIGKQPHSFQSQVRLVFFH